ncbi:ribonuclease HII [Altererythrobacter sp. CAU 1778]
MLCGTPDERFGAGFARPVFGVDEAGRGPLAGPVVAAAVLLCSKPPEGLGDSKVLTAKRRERIDVEIRRHCAWGVGIVEVEEIDSINIFQATMLAMTRAVFALAGASRCAPAEVLVDGNMTPAGRTAGWCWPARAIVKGDAKEPCISAASIVAKEWRDRLMREAAARHPQYGWDRNKGYGTAEHLAALREHGPTPLHRQSFSPVSQLALL